MIDDRLLKLNHNFIIYLRNRKKYDDNCPSRGLIPISTFIIKKKHSYHKKLKQKWYRTRPGPPLNDNFWYLKIAIEDTSSIFSREALRTHNLPGPGRMLRTTWHLCFCLIWFFAGSQKLKSLLRHIVSVHFRIFRPCRGPRAGASEFFHCIIWLVERCCRKVIPSPEWLGQFVAKIVLNTWVSKSRNFMTSVNFFGLTIFVCGFPSLLYTRVGKLKNEFASTKIRNTKGIRHVTIVS